MKRCKNCGRPRNETCTHQQCMGAHEQGYCSVLCQRHYLQVKEYTLMMEEKHYATGKD